jgi:glycerol-3-phosphate dehydrogenase
MGHTGFSVLSREEDLLSARQQTFDLIIIGGGVTGCGIALDATSRGLKTLLVEKSDFASGTSSKSTKLIHGGLRYLKQLEIGLVRETGMERAVVHRIAPHLVHPEKMLLPIVHGGTFNKWSASLAISVYDFLAGVESADCKQTFDKTKTMLQEPLLDKSILKSGIQYSEYRTDDARLTIELVKKAVALGCTAFNYCEVKELKYDNERISGVFCHDYHTETTIDFSGSMVVSAAGPWVDGIREMDKSRIGKSLRLTKGVHIVISQVRLPIKHAVYFDVFDGRMIFAIPRGGTTYIGTSDTDYNGDRDTVVCTSSDVDYILAATNRMFPTVALTKEDVISSWAGLRPLIHEDGKSPSEVSRKDEIFISTSGLISIAGGKLTGYRRMAQRIVRLVYQKLNRPRPKCKTKTLKLTEQPFTDYNEAVRHINHMATDIGYQLAWYLTTVYGRASIDILNAASLLNPSRNLRQRILHSEIDFTIDFECATNPCDFFDRRTGNIYFDMDLVKSEYEGCIARFSERLHWSPSQKTYWSEELSKMIKNAKIYPDREQPI